MSKPYLPPVSKTWFMAKRAYRLFMLRELTSVILAGYLIFLLGWLHQLGQGFEAYQDGLAALKKPLPVLLHLLALAAALYHSITWFNLTPKAMPVRRGEERVPDLLVAIGMGYLPWVVLSALVFWIVLH